MADGWLWLSMRMAAAMPSPTSMTPAFSPGPTSTQSAVVGNRARCIRDDLYEQCSDHITEYMANSRWFGMRWRMCRMSLSSPSVSPKARWTGSGSDVGIAAGIGSSVAVTALTLGGGRDGARGPPVGTQWSSDGTRADRWPSPGQDRAAAP